MEFSFEAEQKLSSPLGAMLTTDRGENCGYATVIYANKVQKKPLWIKAKENLYQSYVNISLLQKRKIPVVPHTCMSDGLVMPRESKLPCNIFFLQNMNSVIMIEVFDRLYEDILLSSEHVDSSRNAMKKEHDQRDWGIILEKAYIDMVPANAFYEEGRLYYFDQEFVKENYPARYVMFRAVKYHYVYLKRACEVIRQETLAKRYGLLEREEQRFIMQNRNQKVCENFYHWTGASRKIITKNTALLLEQSHADKDNGSFYNGKKI